MIGRSILQRLSEILGKSLEEIESMIENIKENFGVSEDIALLEIISRHNIYDEAKDIVQLIRLRQTLLKIGKIKSGMRNISVVGVVETLKFFETGKYQAIILLSDDTGRAQVYVPRKFNNIKQLMQINVGTIISLEDIACIGILSNNQPKLMLTESSSIRILEREFVENFIGIKLPDIKIYDIQEIIADPPSFNEYFHIRAVCMGERTKNNSSVSEKLVLLGSIDDFCRTKLYCILRKAAIHEFNKIGAKPGDIITAHCVFLREADGKKYIVARNLTIFYKQNPKFVAPERVGNGGWWKYYARVKYPPKIGTYRKGEEINRYATLTAELEDGTQIRILVWNEDLLDLIAKIKPGAKIAIFGVIDITDIPKIHIQRRRGFIEILEEGISKESRAIPPHQLIIDFSELRPGIVADVICKITDAYTIRSEKLYGIVKLSDGKQEIKMLVWDKDSFEKIKPLLNSLVRITSIRVRKDRIKEHKLVLFSTKSTKFVPIVSSFDYEAMEQYKPRQKFRTLESLSLGEPTYIYGTITKVEWIGKMYFCRKCGSLIVDLEKKVCEMGHVGFLREKNVVSAIIDDGFFERSVIIPLDELRRLLPPLKYEDIRGITQELIGKELCLFGRLKIEISANIPMRFFLADHICEILGVEAFYERFFTQK